MAEENFAQSETISEDALLDSLFEEPGANREDADHAAPDAEEVAETPEGEEVAQDTPDETAEEPQPAEPQTFTVTIDGKEESVSLDELRAGYQRQADYTRKTQEVAQARKQLETAAEAMKERLAAMAVPQEQEPDWVELAQTMQPQEYLAARAKWDAQQKQSHQARHMLQQIQMQEHSAMLQREQAALLDRIPEWQNRDAARADMAAIVKTGAEYGFSEAEINTVTDHRVILMARELSKLKGAQAALAAQKKTPPAPRAAVQGRAPLGDNAARQQKLMDHLKRTGSEDAAVALLLGG